MKKAAWISMACMAALLGVQQHANAEESIFDFTTGSTYGFAGNGATVTSATVPAATPPATFSTSGTSALDIANKSTQTYGGALTGSVPTDLINAATFTITITIPTTPEAGTPPAPVYYDVVPVYFSTDGEIDPDTSTTSFVNLGGDAPGVYSAVVTQNFYDPDGALTSDATPGQIVAADQAYDGNTTDAITGFQLTVEHGSGAATTTYIDSITVPSASTPEPASLSGLILGGGALIARRRKA